MSTISLVEDNCTACGLHQYSKCPKVQGKGNNVNPLIVFIGEAPGPDEAEKGIPFIGRAGRKLDSMITKSGLTVLQSNTYTTNAVKCFPPVSTKDPSKGFRAPKQTEIDYCKKFLIEEFENFTSVPIIVTLGNVALSCIVGKHQGITKELGELRIVKIGKAIYKLVPNYHPSFILRNNSYENEFIRVLKGTMNFH